MVCWKKIHVCHKQCTENAPASSATHQLVFCWWVMESEFSAHFFYRTVYYRRAFFPYISYLLSIHNCQHLQTGEHQILSHLSSQAAKTNEQNRWITKSKTYELRWVTYWKNVPILRLKTPKADLTIVNFSFRLTDFGWRCVGRSTWGTSWTRHGSSVFKYKCLILKELFKVMCTALTKLC